MSPGPAGNEHPTGAGSTDHHGPGRHDVVGACPLDCPDGCSWVVTVQDGKAVRLRGNPDHPFSRGGLCKKVNPWLSIAAEPGRLLQPLRRVGPKGPGLDPEDGFEPIGWDEALAEIADRFRAVIDTSGPAAIWPYAGTGNVGLIQGGSLPAGDRLWHHLGVSGHVVTICSISGHVGLGYSTGSAAGMDPEDVVDAGTVLIWGSNTLVANQHFWPFVEQARDNGAEIVVIDPVRTRTAARADRHLAPRVGTDGALALGLCNLLITTGRHDRSFVEDRSTGFDEFAEKVREWTVERTAEVCGLEPREITGLADLVAERGPLAVKLGQGMQRHAGGGETSRVISCLPAVVGAFDRPGGGMVYSTSPAYRLNEARAAGTHLGTRPRYLAMTNLARNLNELDDPPVEALFVYAANPVVSNPDTEGVRRGLARNDLFTVVVDIFHTETTDYADIVLPSTMQHEQLEINNSFAHFYLNLNRPAVAPPGECLAHTEIFRRLARSMDLDEPELYATDEELAAALLDTEGYAEAGITLPVLAERGWVRLPGTDAPHRPFADGFPTESGRFEFASEKAEREGHGRLPSYSAPAEAGRPRSRLSPGGRRRYDLIASAPDGHVNSVFAGTDLVRSRASAPTVRIHPDDAAADGLADGIEVEVGNERGSFRAMLVVSDEARSGVAATTKGWWGLGINNTVQERDSDMGRGAVYHDNEVTIRPVE